MKLNPPIGDYKSKTLTKGNDISSSFQEIKIYSAGGAILELVLSRVNNNWKQS